jgi:hypothetical protein
VTIPAVTLPLRDLVLGAFDTVICILDAETGFCADCPQAAGGECPDHRGDAALAREYKAARSQVAGGGVLVLRASGVTR